MLNKHGRFALRVEKKKVLVFSNPKSSHSRAFEREIEREKLENG